MAYVTNGLQLYLDAKDYPSSSTSTTWADKSGNGNNATLSNFTFNGSTSGWTGTELALDGSDDIVILPSAFQTTRFTVEIQFTKIGDSNDRIILDQYGKGYGFAIEMLGDTLLFNGSMSISLDSLSGFNNGSKVVEQLVYDGTNIYIYINNVLKAQSAATFTQVPRLVIGRYGDGGYYYNGKIGMFRIYNRNLASNELTQNYNDAIAVAPIANNAAINAPTATATAQAYNASLTRNLVRTVNAPTATATAQAYTPMVSTPLVATDYVTSGLELYFNAKNKINPSTTWEDLSGNAHNLTLYGFTFDSTDGWDGSSLKFGGNDYARNGSYVPLTTDNEHTNEFVFETAAISPSFTLAAFGATSQRYYLNINGSAITVGLSAGTVAVGNYTFELNRQYHLVIRRTLDRVQMFVNNAMVLDVYRVYQGVIALGTGYRLGQHYEGGNPLNGKIYINRWYSRALTDAEIAQNYANAMGTAPITNNAVINVPTATASAQAYASNIGIVKDRIVTLLTASASSQAYAPSIGTIKDMIINLLKASATAQGYNPSITVAKDTNLAITKASTTAQGYVPTIITNEIDRVLNINLPSISASAQAYVPTIAAKLNITVQTNTASASAQAYSPSTTINKDRNIAAIIASASAQAYNPSVTTLKGTSINLISAQASAQAYTPTFRGIVNVLINTDLSTAIAEAYTPFVQINTYDDADDVYISADTINVSFLVEENIYISFKLYTYSILFKLHDSITISF